MLKRSRFYYVLVAVLLSGATIALGQGQGGKVGFVDSRGVLEGTEEGRQGLEALNTFTEAKRKALATKNSELNQMQQDLLAQQPGLSPGSRTEMENAINAKQIELKRLQEDAQAEVQRRQNELLQVMSEKVQAVIDDFAKQNNYIAIFMKDPGRQAYVDPTLDVTDQIIQLYNQRYPVAASPEPKPADQ